MHPFRTAVLSFVLLLALCSAPGRAAAQEVQVPLDPRGRVETVDARLAASLGLWTAEHPGFREARLFQGPEGWVLEITSARGGRTVRERVPLSAAEAEALRARVAAGLDAGPRAEGGDPGARALLLSGTTLMGLGFYGWAVPAAFEADAEGAVSLYMLTAAGSFFVPWLVTGSDGVTWGEANAALYGASRGPVHGLMLANLLADAEDEPAGPGTGVLLGTAEAVAGLAFARRARLDAGHTHLMGVGGDLGAAYGAGTAILLTGDSGGDDERLVSGMALGGAAAGLVLGHRAARGGDFTWGDAEALRTTALVGALGGGAVAALADVENGRTAAATIMAASAAGLWLGEGAIRERDLSVADGVLLDLGSVAGGALGLGLAYLADPGADDARLYLTAAAAGAAAGFAGTYGAIAPGSGSSGGLAVGGDAGRWSVRVSPEALAAGALLGGRDGRGGAGVPLATVSVRF